MCVTVNAKLNGAEGGLPSPSRIDVSECTRLGFGRIVVSEIEVTDLLIDLVWSRWRVVQGGNAIEPYTRYKDHNNNKFIDYGDCPDGDFHIGVASRGS
jgi:hypothetical protein